MLKSTKPLFLLLVFLLPLTAQSAPQDTAKPDPTVETEVETSETKTPAIDPREAAIPERDIEFEHSDEEHPMKLFRADPKLLEQKYSALVTFSVSEPPTSSHFRLLPAERHDLLIYQEFPVMGSGAVRPAAQLSPKDYFRRLMANLPDDQSPDQEALAFFTGEEVEAGYIQPSFDREGKTWFPEFRILAPTAELAQQRGAALVQLFDYGLVQPIRMHLLNGKRELEKTERSSFNRFSGAGESTFGSAVLALAG